MRRILSSVGTVLLLALVFAAPAAAGPREQSVHITGHPADGVLNQGGRTLDFDHGWKFQLVNTAGTSDPTGLYGNSDDPLVAAPAFDDRAWRVVTLPHDWSIEQQPAATNSGATGYFPGGLGWYRKTFTLPTSMTGKSISVDFDGVYMNSYVYLNGRLLGNHPYGYTGFSFDVSSAVHTDGVTPNVLAVVVQNKTPSSRWYSGSGITRNVHLTVTDPVHVARDGVFVTTPVIGARQADVHVATALVGQGTVTSTILDARGRRIVSSRAADLALPNPHLWSVNDPYLYTLRTVVTVDRRTVDSVDTVFGVRSLGFSPDGGVTLNGRHIKLQGVDLHNDQGALGSVDNYDALWRQMSILKAEGVNAFRTSHNPPSPEMVDVCQRLGIVMMVEAFDAWGTGKVANDYHLYFNQDSDADIAEMVNASKNSPAVIMWSIGNEIPGWTSAANLAVEQRLVADIKAIDTSRPVVAGSDQYRSVPAAGSVAAQMLAALDGLGLNYDPAKVVDGLHAAFPTKFFFESESSSATSARGIYQDPELVNTGENYTPGKRLPSSYDNNMASWTMSDEYGLKKDRDRQYFAGQFIWSGFDYIGEPTPYSIFPVKVSSFGTIDTAGFPKDAYYMFQSQWTSAPMVHIVPMNWTDYKVGEDVTVETYSNQPTVELYLNGRSLGAKSFDAKTSTDGVHYRETTECTHDDKNYTAGACPGSYQSPNGSSGHIHLTWHVPFQPGRLVAVARDTSGRPEAQDQLWTAGAPATVTLTPDHAAIAADGKALSYVTVNVVDQHGVTVPDAANAITFAVTGAGTFAGADNGKQDDAEGYLATTHTAFNGKVLAIIQAKDGTPGPITIHATSPGLAPATTTVLAGRTGILPAYVRTPAGARPQLPSTVTSVRSDGSTRTERVRWHSPGPARLGTTTITGDVPGSEAVITGYRAASIQPYATVVPVGIPPGLPARVTIVDTDGTTHDAAAVWDPVPPSAYATAGTFVARGRAAGLTVTATVRVTDDFVPEANIARAASPTHPSADAGYSGGPSEIPGGMLDGNTTTGGWSNFYNKSATSVLPAVSVAHASEWVSVRWPDMQRLTSVVPYFTVGTNRVLPRSILVSYWNGTGWTPVAHQQTTLATVSAQPSTITFDPVSTTSLRLDLTSPQPGTSTGFLQITELQVPAAEVR